MSTANITRMNAAEANKARASHHPRLHNERSIGIATFIGSPLAGGILFVHNCIKLSRWDVAALASFTCLVSTAFMIMLGMVVPASVSLGYFLPLAAALAFQKITKSTFGVELERIASGKAKAHSVWLGVLSGLVVAAAFIAVIASTL